MRARTGDLPPTSAKVRKILEILEEISHRDHKEKTIIFSQFTSMLDILEPFLTDAGSRHVRCEDKNVFSPWQGSLLVLTQTMEE